MTSSRDVDVINDLLGANGDLEARVAELERDKITVARRWGDRWQAECDRVAELEAALRKIVEFDTHPMQGVTAGEIQDYAESALASGEPKP